MSVHILADMTWEEVAALDTDRTVPVLPLGAVEAHGPHLPLLTDVIIAEAMVDAAGVILHGEGLGVLRLPPIAYTAAPFAAGFPGTLAVSPQTVTRLVVEITRSVASHGFGCLGIASAHLDPTHIGSITASVRQIEDEQLLTPIFPDITRKPWALRLTDEFKSGACHAGQYEGSVVMAARPDLVRDAIQASLPANPSSLSTAIRSGKRTFEEAGGERAYFGYPAQATRDEGRRTIEILGGILAEALLAGRP